MKKTALLMSAVLLLLCGCTDIANTAPMMTDEVPAEAAVYIEEDIHPTPAGTIATAAAATAASSVTTTETSVTAAETEETTADTEETAPETSETTPDTTENTSDTEELPADTVPEQTETALLTAAETVPPVTAPDPSEGAGNSVSIVCAGDNLIHTPIYRLARREDGSYDFSGAYKHLGTLISDADLAILNQETILSDDFEPSSWPFFCTPTDMADDMIKLGFDVFSISNNHVLDKGEEGLKSTLRYWKDRHPEIPVYGAYISEDDMNNIRTVKVNGITFAFLGYMEHTNGLQLPSGSECRITYLSDLDTIKEQVQRAAEISDCVIVSAHFGIEVSNTVTEQQYTLSQKLADWGADIIIGTQPHTVQSMEYLTAADGRRSFVFYCLGNLVSTMDDPLAMAEILGRITVTKYADGSITLSDAGAYPLVDYYDSAYTYVGVFPLSEYTDALAGTHALPACTRKFIIKLFRDNIPKEFMDRRYTDLIYS